MKRILIPLPSTDFDPTEAAVPWDVLTQAGHTVVFATPKGQPARGDDRMLSGRGLGLWTPILRAQRGAREQYARMVQDPAFRAPLAYGDLRDVVGSLDGLVLPGGHAQGMREYLESALVQDAVVSMMAADRVVGAICHGVVVMARSVDRETKRSVLWGRQTTSLLASQELAAWWMTRAWLGGYYRTYPETVESEVIRALASERDFQRGPRPLLRDNPNALHRGFTVVDGRYVSARWPGDAHAFARALLELLSEG